VSALWRAHELAIALGVETPGFDVAGICIDTRLIQPGDLFVALPGERDGNDYVAEAFAKGAAGALVSRDVGGGGLLIVDDTLAALTRLAEFSRARSGAKIIAVTGSVGKTTVKEMLRAALGALGAVHAAEASFNNHIGVPLTLARLPVSAAFAVLEIGMNHPGEIAPLTRLARPHVALVTNVEAAHIGLMGSLEAIAAEKAQIFRGLIPAGTAIAPRDSAFLTTLLRTVPTGAAKMTFGAGDLADARLLDAESDATGCDVIANVAGAVLQFRLAAAGRHMALNALAALAACHALGLDLPQAAAALHGFAPVAGRGRRQTLAVAGGEALLLDESYNASGASMRAALAVLALQPGRHVAVLGEMLELGDEAEHEHLALLPALAAADLVFTCGELMGELFDSLPPEQQGAHAANAESLAPLVQSALRPGDAILVKGSYGSRMRDVIALLKAAA
jgi:UDP-N-acetylmuramoyl-tripeptide--D-alanyl-D-alanine ligase